MNILSKRYLKLTMVAAITATLGLSVQVSAKNLLYTPDGRTIHIKGGALQPDLSMYRSQLASKVVDRRFYTNDATYAANEAFKTGMEGFNDFVKASMPVSYRRAFQWITSKEVYFYARYLLDYVGGRGHAGVHMVQGPYWTMKALQHSNYNRLQRDRGERQFSNKDVMLGFYLPMVYQRVGFPRVFDDIQVSYLQYAAVDPHFTGELDNADTFKDPMSGKNGGWGQPNTYLNNYPQRFDHDKMDSTLDMGAIGQFVKRRMQWADYFFHSEHKEESSVSRGTEVNMMGNDAEEGLRGWGLTLSSTNTLLEIKSSMFTDGKSLMGIDPSEYNPDNGLRYIPHAITPNLLLAGDIPERIVSIQIKDNSSQLWDQAAWIWGATAYATTVVRRPTLFTDNPPVDGGMIEKSLGIVAESLANSVLKNVQAMHTRNGLLVSEWTPAGGAGATVTMKDLTMAMVALRDLEQSWDTIGKYQDEAEKARKLLEDNARFLLSVQGKDGAFYEGYSVETRAPIGSNKLSANHWAGIRALLAAYFTTEDEDFLRGARKSFNLLNQEYWLEAQGVYYSTLGDDNVVIDNYGLGIAMAAMREMFFATPSHKVDAQIERFTRWWIQSVDNSGAMMAETERTGEIYTGFNQGDDDGDGIPFVTQANGKHGIAPLIAGKVVINVGGSQNLEFAKLKGDVHDPDLHTHVRMNYQQQTLEQQQDILVPLDYPPEDGLVERDYMERIDGTVIPLQPSKPVKFGYGDVMDLTGRQIFEANCAGCHGYNGEGIDGLALAEDMERTHEAMEKIVRTGRFEKLMPPWGKGNDAGFSGTLTESEIDKVVDYVQSEGFRKRYNDLENGIIEPNALPRDVWYYLSRENARMHGTLKADASDAQRYIVKHQDPAKIVAPNWENLKRNTADADLKLTDRKTLHKRVATVDK